MYRLLCVVAEEWRQMEDQIEQLDREIEAIATSCVWQLKLVHFGGLFWPTLSY
jgi:hypothetical protein